MTPMKLRFAMASMGHPETKVSTLCQELGITRQTLYRHISPDGQLRADGIKLLNNRKRKLTAVCSHQTRIGNLDAHLI